MVNANLTDSISLLQHPKLGMILHRTVANIVTLLALVHNSVPDQEHPEPAERSETHTHREARVRELEVLRAHYFHAPPNVL